jgi:hypothetical protein
VPANPGPSAAVVAGMMAAVIAETTRLHQEATQVYRTYHNVYQAIKKLTIESFDDAYLNALSDKIVGYANCTSLQLLTHLLTYYAMIAPTELTHNYERLNTPCDPNQPIETLFQQILLNYSHSRNPPCAPARTHGRIQAPKEPPN